MNDIWKQMVGGGRYDANHRELVARREKTRNLLWEYNMLPPSLKTELNALIDRIIGSHGKTYDIIQPFRCDYGDNISFGENFFANFNLTILDEAKVTIGDNVFIGPNVSLYTACHPLDPAMTATVESNGLFPSQSGIASGSAETSPFFRESR